MADQLWGDGPITWQQAIQSLATRVAALEREATHRAHADPAPGGQAGVLITRKNGEIFAQHIIVHHTTLLNAADALSTLARLNVAFVRAMDASAVLDALGVKGG